MRLTKKIGIDEYTSLREIDDNQVLLAHRRLVKLGQLEDIEEELGIDLVTFFKIRKHCNDRKSIFIKDKGEIIKSDCRVELCYKSVAVHTGDYGADSYSLKDYGKTWALTKEELL